MGDCADGSEERTVEIFYNCNWFMKVEFNYEVLQNLW